MAAERREFAVDSRAKFVDLATSTAIHFSAFLELECLEKARAKAFETGDYWPYERFRDLTGQRRIIDESFRGAWEEVRGVFNEYSGNNSPEDNISLLAFAREDYRVDLMEIAIEVANDEKARGAFGYIKKIRLIDQEHKYYEPEQHKDGGFCLLTHNLYLEASRKGLSTVANRLNGKLSDAVKKSGVIGPFGEQFLIESIDRQVIKVGALRDEESPIPGTQDRGLIYIKLLQ